MTLSGLRFTASKLAGSAIEDFGNGSLVIAACDISDNFDIDNIVGIAGGNNADIGAVEAQALFVSNVNDSGAGSLR